MVNPYLMKLIDKDRIVAEINRVLNSYDPNQITSGRYALVELRDFLDTIEMEEYICKSTLVVKIKKLMYSANTEADIASTGECFNEDIANAKYQLCKYILDVIDTLTVKEVDTEKRRGMTYNELAEVFKRDGGDAQVCFSVINQNQILFGNNETKTDIISLKNEEPISE